MQIDLSLSVEQINLILSALNELPNKTVGPLVNEITQQATTQVQAAQLQERERLAKEFLAQELYKMEVKKQSAPNSGHDLAATEVNHAA